MTDNAKAIEIMTTLTEKLVYEPNEHVDPLLWDLKDCMINRIILRNLAKFGEFKDSAEAAIFIFNSRVYSICMHS